jgi:NAD(P)-dependent dehydrogenase (short-subunit alcohol dehydrogenase family)
MPTKNAVALVTGANRGIGLEVCRQLAGRGYTVLLTARDPDKATRAARALQQENGLAVLAQQLDVTDPDSVAQARDRVARDFGRLDVLINNAAVDYDTDQRVLTADLGRVRDAFETNTIGVMRTIQVFVPLLRKSDHGRIVNVTSGSGALASMNGRTPAYSLSKVALNALTLMVAATLEGSGILVNAVCPGWVATDMGGPGGGPVSKGAGGVVWGATLPDDGPTGGFFRHGRPVSW